MLSRSLSYAKIVQGECRTKLALVMLSRSLSYAKIVQGECRTKLALVMLSRSLSYAKIVQGAETMNKSNDFLPLFITFQ